MAGILDGMGDDFVGSVKRGAGAYISQGARALQDAGIDTAAAQAYGNQLVADNPAKVNSIADMRSNPITALSESVGGAAPGIASALGAAKIGQMAGTALGGVVGRGNPAAENIGGIAGGIVGQAVPDLLTFYGGNRQQQDAAGIDSPGAAAAGALGQAALNQVPLLPVKRLLRIPGTGEAARGLGDIAKDALKFGAIGAATAPAQEAISRAQSGQSVAPGEDTDYTKSAIEGGTTGAVLGAGSASAERLLDHMKLGHAIQPQTTVVDPGKGPISRATVRGANDGAVDGVVTPAQVRASLPTFEHPFVPEQAPSPAAQEFHQEQPADYSAMFDGRAINIPAGKNLKPTERVVEQRAAQQVLADPMKAVADYSSLPDTDGGRIINTDEARELFPDYGTDANTRSAFSYAVHEPASWVAKEQYANRLAQPVGEGMDPVVMFTAGGTGAGKSTAIKRVEGLKDAQDKADIVYDGNLQSFASAKTKIDQALESGRAASIVYVNRDPVESFTQGAIPRAAKDDYGRTVPFDAHADTHIGAAQTISQLAEHYKDNPNVDIRIVNNEKNAAKIGDVTDVSHVAGMNRDTLISELKNGLEQERQAGRVPDRVYNFYRDGAEAPQRGTAGEVQGEGARQEAGRDGGEPAQQGQGEGLSETPVHETPEFKQWFGEESNLRNEDGSPKILYHGTNKDFTEFKESDRGFTGKGAYFGLSPETADTYAGGNGANIMPVYARGKFLSHMKFSDYVHKFGWKDARAKAEADGYTGVIDENYEDAVNVWNPEKNIKSALGNSGKFDASNPDIRARAVDPNVPVNGKGLAPRAVSDLVSRQTKNWKSGPTVEVVPTNDHLPEAVRKALGNKAVDGAYDGNGKIYVVADKVNSAKDVRRIIAHEGYAHYGVKGVLGDKFGEFLSKLDALKDTDEDIRKAYAATQDRYGSLSPEERADEVVAHLAENYATLKGRAKVLVAQIVSAIKNFLRMKLNIQSEMSSNDVLAIIAKAKKAIESKGITREQAIAGARASAQADPFYSAVSRSVATAKGAPKTADPAAWKQWLDGAQRRGEFKGSEREWLGLDAWLDSQRGKVSREDINEFVRNNSVKLDETTLGDKEGSPTHYDKYTLPGGKNYREVLLHLPKNERGTQWDVFDTNTQQSRQFATRAEAKAYANEDHTNRVVSQTETGRDDYNSSHFKQPNVIAHLRLNDRTSPKGEKILHIEEIQSDWHQAGRKQGYGPAPITERTSPSGEKLYMVDENVYTSRAEAERHASKKGVPDAPFKKEWPILAFKRALREAVENGYDKVTWTTGEQQAARYPRAEGSQEKIAMTHGMESFYDKILPNEIGKYVKQWDGRVGETKIVVPESKIKFEDRNKTAEERGVYPTIHSLDITPAMRESVRAGQPMFSVARASVPAPAEGFDGWTHPSAKLDRYLTDSAGARMRAYLDVAKQKGDKLRTMFQDYFLPVRRVQEAITAHGGNVEENSDVYGREELYYGRTGSKLEALERDHVKPLAKAIADSGVKLDDAELYLYAKFAPERNARIASINPELQDGGSGMTNADAAKVIDDFKKQGLSEKLDKIADRVYALNEVRVKALEESGLISKEAADAWREDKHYVPLKGFADGVDDEAPATRPPIGAGFSVGGKEAWRALGRRSRATDIIANAVAQTDQAIIRAGKNRVAQALLKLAQDNPNKALWEVNATQNKAGFDKGTGEVVYRKTNEPDAVIAKVDGEEYRINIRDQRFLEAMKNMGSAKVGAVLRSFGAINRVLSLTRTSLSPEFVVSNPARDIQTAGVNLVGKMDAKTAAKAITVNMPHAIKAMWGQLGGKKVGGEWARWAQEFDESGAMTHFVNQKTVEERQAKIEGLIKQAQGGGRQAAANLLRGTAEFINHLNGTIENGTRLSAYAEARRSGASIEQAARLAKNLTVNFNRKGQYGSAMNAMFLFYNASIQGAWRFMHAMKSPAVQGIMASTAALGFGLGYYNRVVGGKDDDGQDMWDKVPDFERERNLVVMNAFGKGSNLKIPMPYTYNLPFLVGQNIADMTFGKKDAAQGAMSIANALINAFDPLGSVDLNADATQGIVKTASPTVLQPFVDLAFNKNNFGSPIMPQQDPNAKVKLPDSETFFKGSTNPQVVALARELNRLTGGNPVRSGGIDVSPASMTYLFDYLTGGTGSFVDRVATSVGLAARGEDVPVNKIPFVRTFVSQPQDSRVNDTYYAARDDVNQKAEMAKVARKPGAFPDATANEKEEMRFGVSLESSLRTTDKALSELRRVRLAAQSSGNDAKVKEIEQKERDVMTRFNRVYFQRKEAGSTAQ